MKAKIAVSMVVLVIIALLVGCAGVRKVKAPGAELVLGYELGGLCLTRDAKQMSGVPIDHAKLAVGETVVIYARGVTPEGKWFKLPDDVVVNWEAGREVEVTPTVGHVVTAKVVEPISLVCYITATTTTKDGKKIDTMFAISGK